jgi:phenylalanyl-tRNA synthetase beta chain
MLYSCNWLQDYYATKLPKPDKLADLLSMHAFEAEAPRQAQGKNPKSNILEIDVLPNRAHDCLNHIGMAREIAAIEGKKLKLPKSKKIKVRKGNVKPLKVTIESAELVPRYTALVIEGVKLGKSPKKVQEYLAAVGVNSINNIVDLTNFVMLEIGQPLHAFDYDQIQGSSMNVRLAREGEKLETLDDQEFTMPNGALVIEDAKRLIDLAGIMGGKVSAISQSASRRTKNIVLQAANFQSTGIYKAKTVLRHTTQAANIYAHEIDPNLTMEALTRANQLLQEWGIGGNTVQVIDIYPKKVLPKHVSFDVSFAESLLGVSISKVQTKKILQDLGCKVTEKGGRLDVEIPTRRIDLTIEEDLVEEIGRMHGYENIPAEFPTASLIPPKRNRELYWQEMIRNSMKELGFTETYNYSFIGQKDLTHFAYTLREQAQLAELENPISEDFTYMRDSLLENLLKNIQNNYKKIEDIRIFEIGKIFKNSNKGLGETRMLGAVVHGGSFYNAKGIADFLFDSLGITGAWYDTFHATPQSSRPALWHTGKSAEIKIGSQEIGFVGEISAGITSNLKIRKSVAALHIDGDKLIQLASEEKGYRPLSKFPSTVRDIAILVPTQTQVIDIMNIMNIAGGTLVDDIDLFDMFEGGNLPEGKKNLAFHIVYQANDRTLESKEVDTLHNSIMKQIEENPSWEVRK